MVEDGMMVYYLVSGFVMEGRIINVTQADETQTFEIEGVGGCDGPHILSSSQLHHTVFLSKEEALEFRFYEQAYLITNC